MSNSEIPEFRISSEISICKDSFLDNIPERFINVEIQIIHNNDNDNSLDHQTVKPKNKKASRKKYVYTSTALERSRWPKLKISSSYIRESPYSRKNKDNEKDQNNDVPSSTNKIILRTSLTQSLQSLSKEEEEKIANQSPRTRPLKYPCFSSYASVNRNLVIPTSDVPIKELPHPLQSKTIKEYPSYTYQKNDTNDPFMRFNGYSANDPYFGTSSTRINSSLYSSSIYHPRDNYTQTSKKPKNNQTKKKSSTPKSAKTNKISTIETPSATTTFDTSSPYFDYNSAAKTMMPQPSVPVIFRTEMRKKNKNEFLNNRPYFTTCQEPLSKRPATINEMRSTSSHII